MALGANARDEITVERRYYSGRFNEAETFEALLSDADWQRVQDALGAVDCYSC